MFDFAKIRQAAHVSQVEAAVRARVSPPTARAFERHGPEAVIESDKRARLLEVYEGLRRDVELGGGRAA